MDEAEDNEGSLRVVSVVLINKGKGERHCRLCCRHLQAALVTTLVREGSGGKTMKIVVGIPVVAVMGGEEEGGTFLVCRRRLLSSL